MDLVAELVQQLVLKDGVAQGGESVVNSDVERNFLDPKGMHGSDQGSDHGVQCQFVADGGGIIDVVGGLKKGSARLRWKWCLSAKGRGTG